MDSCLCCGEITKYKCIACNLPVCNRCTVFEGNEETDGWCSGISVGYCNDCQMDFSVNEKTKVIENLRQKAADCNDLDEACKSVTSSPSPEETRFVLEHFECIPYNNKYKIR